MKSAAVGNPQGASQGQTIDAPILIGRPDVVLDKARRHGVTIAQDDYTIVNPENHADYEGNCETYLGLI